VQSGDAVVTVIAQVSCLCELFEHDASSVRVTGCMFKSRIMLDVSERHVRVALLVCCFEQMLSITLCCWASVLLLWRQVNGGACVIGSLHCVRHTMCLHLYSYRGLDYVLEWEECQCSGHLGGVLKYSV
jgi:hypothetical protein